MLVKIKKSIFNNKNLFSIFFLIVMLGVMIICLFVPYVAVVTSLQSDKQVLSVPAEFIPNPVKFINYVNIWIKTPLAQLLFNGLIVTASSIILVLLFATPAAFALAKLEIPGKKFIIMLILFTQMFSPIVVLLPLFNLFRVLHLLDSYLGLVIVDTTFCLAFATLLLSSFFETIPDDVMNAASIDGCNQFQIITRVILPISAPGIFVVTIYIFTEVWNEFLFAFTFITTSNRYTPIVGLFSLIQPPGTVIPPWNLAMAMSVIISIPVVLLFYFRKSDMVEGLGAGAIK